MEAEERRAFLDYMMLHHKKEVLEALLTQPHMWPDGVKTNTDYSRIDDMHGRTLRIFIQEDGDVVVSIWRSKSDQLSLPLSVEFCTPGAGGGISPRTRAVLLWLVRAMQMDAEEYSGPPTKS